jgi:hypothetical protein
MPAHNSKGFSAPFQIYFRSSTKHGEVLAACGCGDACKQGAVHIAAEADCVDGDVVSDCLLGVVIAVGALAVGEQDYHPGVFGIPGIDQVAVCGTNSGADVRSAVSIKTINGGVYGIEVAGKGRISLEEESKSTNSCPFGH